MKGTAFLTSCLICKLQIFHTHSSHSKSDANDINGVPSSQSDEMEVNVVPDPKSNEKEVNKPSDEVKKMSTMTLIVDELIEAPNSKLDEPEVDEVSEVDKVNEVNKDNEEEDSKSDQVEVNVAVKSTPRESTTPPESTKQPTSTGEPSPNAGIVGLSYAIANGQKEKIEHNESLPMPQTVTNLSFSAADSDKGFAGKPKMRMASQSFESIGAMGTMRTMRGSIKVKSEIAWIENVMRCCVAENGFDLYQIIAFDADTKETWQDWIKYFFYVLKAVLCALTQIFGIIIIMFDFIESGLVGKGWCNPTRFDISCEFASKYSLTSNNIHTKVGKK